MTAHPFYHDAVLLLAELHSATPQIIHEAAHDPDSAEGLQIQREVNIICNFAEAIASRGRNVVDTDKGNR